MPVLSASGVGVRNRRRWLFRDLDVQVEAGELAVVVGPPGSGRTTMLLALAERFRLTAGTVEVAGVAALGHVAGVHEPEPGYTVAEHVRERLLLLGRPAPRSDVREASEAYGLDPALLGWELSPYHQQLLGLTLARLSGPQLIALDGVDVGLDLAEQAALWRILGKLTETGVAVLATARQVASDVPATVHHLGPHQPPAPEPPAERTQPLPAPANGGGR
jgi:ABC-2 type transport system ATP-binding protein